MIAKGLRNIVHNQIYCAVYVDCRIIFYISPVRDSVKCRVRANTQLRERRTPVFCFCAR